MMATDEELIQQIQQGEREAYGQLFRKYYSKIYSVCLSILENQHDAEEATQEAFVQAYLKLSQLKKPGKFYAWLKKIAQNYSKECLRKRGPEIIPLDLASVQTAGEEDSIGGCIPTQRAPDEQILRQELRDAIMESIEALPPKDREVVRAYIDGLNHSEISKRLGISIEASMSRLYRARKKLAASVKDLLHAIFGFPKIFPLKKIVSGGILAMKVSVSAKYTVIVIGAIGIMCASLIGVKSFFLSPQENTANLGAEISQESSQQASPPVGTVDKPSSSSVKTAPAEAKKQPQKLADNKSKTDDGQSDDMLKALEVLDYLDKLEEDSADKQEESANSSDQADEEFREIYLAGVALLKEKRYEEAKAVFDELLLRFPNSPLLHAATYCSGIASYAMKRYEEAASKFDEFALYFPNSPFVEKATHFSGRASFQMQQYEEAASKFDEFALRFPNSPFVDEAIHLSAQASLIMKRYEEAASKFDGIVSKFPNTKLAMEADYKSSYCLKRLGRDDEALRRYEQHIINYPNNLYITAAYFDMGSIYKKQGNIDRAIENYRLALQHAEDPKVQAAIQEELEQISAQTK